MVTYSLSLPYFSSIITRIFLTETPISTREGYWDPPSRFWCVPYLRFWGRRLGWLSRRDVVTGQIFFFVLPSNQRRKTDHETQYPDTCSTCTAFVKDQTKIIQVYEHCTSSRNKELRTQRFERSHINIQCVHKIPPGIQDSTVLQGIELDKCNLLCLTVNHSKF
jgi:hypothetical protein